MEDIFLREALESSRTRLEEAICWYIKNGDLELIESFIVFIVNKSYDLASEAAYNSECIERGVLNDNC